MSFANSNNTIDESNIVRYNFGYSIDGFNENTSFISSSDNIGINRIGDESQTTQFWLNSPRSVDEHHDSGSLQGSVVGPHQIYTPILSYISSDHDDRLHSSYEYTLNSGIHDCQSSTRDLSTNEQILADHLQVLQHNHSHNPPFVRVVKRRTTANKKERRRTQSINNAYADLRDCINVPADTKLSKIKTLRLALSYINYLTGILGANDDSTASFQVNVNQANYQSQTRTGHRRSTTDTRCHISDDTSSAVKKGTNNDEDQQQEHDQKPQEDSSVHTRHHRANSKASKGRTGWPQHLWAMELKQQQSY